jgi:hypothetical protein
MNRYLAWKTDEDWIAVITFRSCGLGRSHSALLWEKHPVLTSGSETSMKGWCAARSGRSKEAPPGDDLTPATSGSSCFCGNRILSRQHGGFFTTLPVMTIMIWTKCKHANPNGSNFCNACGQTLQGVDEDWEDHSEGGATTSHGERRVVTILFSDLKGFTSLSEKLDPEELRDIINRIFRSFVLLLLLWESSDFKIWVTFHENDEIGQDYRIDGRVNPLLFHVFPVDPKHRLARKRFELDHFLCALIRPTQALDLQEEKQSCKSCESCRLHFREQLQIW